MLKKRRGIAVGIVIGVVISLVISGGTAFAAVEDWPVIQSAIPLDPEMERDIAAIVAEMSLEEKIGQMTQVEIGEVTPEEITTYHIGSVLNGGGSWPGNEKHARVEDWVSLADTFWEASMETPDGKTAIPIIWGTDAVHGHSNVYGATIFPHNIGLGAAHDPDLIERIGVITAREVSATGIDWTFSPCVAVARDDRWGRTYESYSEHPDLVKAYAGRFIKGLQDAFSHTPDPHVIASVKHYIGDGGTAEGTDRGDTVLSEEELIEIHAQGYVSALGAGAQTVMASFSSWNGMNMHGHAYLLTDVLKKRMGFDGFVVSDWNGIAEVPGCTSSSCPHAIIAGIDMVMAPYRADWKACIANTIEQVKSGDIPMARLDDAVTRILRVKKRAGLFERGKPSSRLLANESDVLGADEHRAVAREAVRKSLVLLKNQDGILPLARDARVLVAGKNADNIGNQSGGWTLTWQGTDNTNADFPGGTSIWQGIQQVAPNAELSEDGSTADPARHDVAVVVIGEAPYAETTGDIGDHQTLEHAGRYPEDLAVIQTIADKGIPIVTIVISGRPLYMNKELNRSDAFVAAWLPGTEGGGVADVIFRQDDGSINVDFSGTLSFSWPGSPCQTPLNVGDEDYAPLFAYGYGLTYSDTGTLKDDLAEPERTYGCGQSAPGEAGVIDSPLQLFVNGANGKNGAERGEYVLRIGGPSNWNGTDVSNDPNAVTTLPDNEVEVSTEDGTMQFSAKRVVWNAMGQVYSQIKRGAPGVDLTAYLNSETSLMFRVKVNSAPDGNVSLAMHCEYPCLGEIPFADPLKSLADGQWHEVSVPLQCFVTKGLDPTNVNTPFLIWTDGAMDLSIEDIRLEPGIAGPKPDCSSFVQPESH